MERRLPGSLLIAERSSPSRRSTSSRSIDPNENLAQGVSYLEFVLDVH